MFIFPDEILLQKMKPIFDNQAVLVTYMRWLGVDRTGDEPVELWDSRSVYAMTGKRKKFSTTATKEVVAQVLSQTFLFRSPDLFAANDAFPDGIQFTDLTENDQVILGNTTYGLQNHRFAFAFVHAEVRGS